MKFPYAQVVGLAISLFVAVAVCWFNIFWLMPLIACLALFVFGIALRIISSFFHGRLRRALAFIGFVAIFQVFAIPVHTAIGQLMENRAKSYCGELAGIVKSRQMEGTPLPEDLIHITVPGRRLPRLLSPGYSPRYTFSFHAGTDWCTANFPAVAGGRTSWQGELSAGIWHWELMMD